MRPPLLGRAAGLGGLNMLVAKMDEEARCNDFGWARDGAEQPCSERLCNRSDRPFADLSAGAAWRQTEGMAWEACKARARVPLHPLCGLTLLLQPVHVILGPHAWRGLQRGRCCSLGEHSGCSGFGPWHGQEPAGEAAPDQHVHEGLVQRPPWGLQAPKAEDEQCCP